MPFADGSFDAVVLGEVLEHVEDDRAALQEAARVMTDNGVLAISVPRNPAWFSQSDQWAGHVRRYTRGRLWDPVKQVFGPSSSLRGAFRCPRSITALRTNGLSDEARPTERRGDLRLR